jgi:hypothetical protein
MALAEVVEERSLPAVAYLADLLEELGASRVLAGEH